MHMRRKLDCWIFFKVDINPTVTGDIGLLCALCIINNYFFFINKILFLPFLSPLFHLSTTDQVPDYSRDGSMAFLRTCPRRTEDGELGQTGTEILLGVHWHDSTWAFPRAWPTATMLTAAFPLHDGGWPCHWLGLGGVMLGRPWCDLCVGLVGFPHPPCDGLVLYTWVTMVLTFWSQAILCSLYYC